MNKIRQQHEEKIMKMKADDWQLYTHMKGAGLAAHRLSKAACKALRLLDEEFAAGNELTTAVEAAFYVIQTARRKPGNSDLGAGDTEPRGVSQDIIWRYIAERYNCEPYGYVHGLLYDLF